MNLELMKQAVKICQALHHMGVCPGAHGNMSYLDSDSGVIIITKTGCRMDEPVFVEAQLDDASSDTDLHQEFYRKNSNVDWVIHCHGILEGLEGLEMLAWSKEHGSWLGFKFPIDEKKLGKVFRKYTVKKEVCEHLH